MNKRYKCFKAALSSMLIAVLVMAAAAPVPVAAAPKSAPASVLAPADIPSVWAADEVYKAREYGLIPDGMYHSFVENMTRAEFCKLVMALYTKITTKPERLNLISVFNDTIDVSIINAYELGIVKGVGGGRFSPDTAITRQEIAVMLYNAIKAINAETGKNILKNTSVFLTFVDWADTDDWAVEAIRSLRNNEIMLGDDKNRFNPLDSTTKEMAFILVNRTYLIYSGLDAKKSFPAAYTGEILMRIKGSFSSGGDYRIIGDVFELYPYVTISDLTRYLDGDAFHDTDGEAYHLDKTESLSESVSIGYGGEIIAGGKYYPVYVFARDSLPQFRLFLVYDGLRYGFYLDPGRKEPFLQKTFSDVLFDVPESTPVLLGLSVGATSAADAAAATDKPNGGVVADGVVASGATVAAGKQTAAGNSLTFSILRKDAPELLDRYLWRIQLAQGSVTRLTAISL